MNSNRTDRNVREASFWDAQATTAKSFRRHFYTQVNDYLWRQIMQELNDLSGRRVLFGGCGTSAAAAKEIARRGADVWCVDISPRSVDRLMQHPFGMLRERIHPVVADVEDLPFDEGHFDVVVCKAVVHHLDVPRFMAEIGRVCVPGALVILSEPLAANPLIRLLRWLTPASRVPTEHPLTRKDLNGIAGWMVRMRTRHNFLLALGSLPWFWLGLRRTAGFMFKVGCMLDRLVMAIFPPASLLAWNVTMAGHLKPSKDDVAHE